jgi:AcrR family transcriptional regulator
MSPTVPPKHRSARVPASAPRAGRDKLDRRIARTRKLLREALVSLVLERGWDAVTLTDVCERADVGRSTLYLHFADKEDLLFSGFANLEEALESVRAAAPGQFAFAREFVLHVQDNLRLFRALVTKSAGRHVITHLRGVATRLVRAEVQSLGIGAAQLPSLSSFISGGLVELVIGWLEKPTRQSTDELVGAFVRFSRGLVKLAK